MTQVRSYSKREELSKLFHNRKHTIVMGVVNVTPDSFSDGGRFFDSKAAIDHALGLIDDGADIIDVGGESTRPGSDPVTPEEQIRRVLAVVESLARVSSTPISVDTTSSVVAERVLQEGAVIINDVSALSNDDRLASVVAQHEAGLILMHKRGSPKEMQQDTKYANIVEEVTAYLACAITRAESSGIASDLIMVDPGIGFGKDLTGNLELIRSLSQFANLGKPVMVGASRKSFIGQITGAEADARLHGSVAAAVAAVINGAAAVRVHDVKETRQAVDVAIELGKSAR